MATPLEREEYVEQAYFFRVFRERLADNLPAQEILSSVHDEVLTTTRLPLALQFLATDLKHSGLMGPAFGRMGHYFTPYQAFVMSQAEAADVRLTMPVALLLLEREAQYRADGPTMPGLFVYQFEAICRNRLGYTQGLRAMANDPLYTPDWKKFLENLIRQLGAFDLPDIVYMRSEALVEDQTRLNRDYVSPLPPLFGVKEGKIAYASRGRDPIYFFSALQRQLRYPEVPRSVARDAAASKLEMVSTKIREMEARIKLLEGEVKGQVDLSQFKPEMFRDQKDEV